MISLVRSTPCRGQQKSLLVMEQRVVLASDHHGASCLKNVIILIPAQSPTQQERQAALFNSTAVHASFGDVELAQITLRGLFTLVPCSYTDLQMWSSLH